MRQSVITKFHPLILLVQGAQRSFSTVERLYRSRGSAHIVIKKKVVFLIGKDLWDMENLIVLVFKGKQKFV